MSMTFDQLEFSASTYSKPQSSSNSDAIALIKQQLTKIKLLVNENNMKQNQIQIFKEKIYDLEDISYKQSEQLKNLKQAHQMMEQDYEFKLQHSDEQIDLLQKLNNQLNNSIRDYQEKIAGYQAEYLQMEAQINQNDREQHVMQEEMKTVRQSLNQIQIATKNTKYKWKEGTQQLAQLKSKNAAFQIENNQLKNSIQSLKQELEKKNKNFKLYEEVKEKFSNFQEKYDKETQQAELAKTQLRQKSEQLEAELKAFQNSKKSEIEGLNTKISSLKESNGKLQNELNDLNTQLGTKNQEIAGLNNRQAELERDIKESNQKVESELNAIFSKIGSHFDFGSDIHTDSEPNISINSLTPSKQSMNINLVTESNHTNNNINTNINSTSRELIKTQKSNKTFQPQFNLEKLNGFTQIKKQIDSYAAQITALKREIVLLNEKIAEISENNNFLKQQKQDLVNLLEDTREDFGNQMNELNRKHSQQVTFTQMEIQGYLKQVEFKLNNLEQECLSLQQDKFALSQELQQQQNKSALTETEQKKLELRVNELFEKCESFSIFKDNLKKTSEIISYLVLIINSLVILLQENGLKSSYIHEYSRYFYQINETIHKNQLKYSFSQGTQQNKSDSKTINNNSYTNGGSSNKKISSVYSNPSKIHIYRRYQKVVLTVLGCIKFKNLLKGFEPSPDFRIKGEKYLNFSKLNLGQKLNTYVQRALKQNPLSCNISEFSSNLMEYLSECSGNSNTMFNQNTQIDTESLLNKLFQDFWILNRENLTEIDNKMAKMNSFYVISNITWSDDRTVDILFQQHYKLKEEVDKMNNRVVSLGNYAIQIEEETTMKENIMNITLNEYETKIQSIAGENEELKKQLQNISFSLNDVTPQPLHYNLPKQPHFSAFSKNSQLSYIKEQTQDLTRMEERHQQVVEQFNTENDLQEDSQTINNQSQIMLHETPQNGLSFIDNNQNSRASNVSDHLQSQLQSIIKKKYSGSVNSSFNQSPPTASSIKAPGKILHKSVNSFVRQPNFTRDELQVEKPLIPHNK